MSLKRTAGRVLWGRPLAAIRTPFIVETWAEQLRQHERDYGRPRSVAFACPTPDDVKASVPGSGRESCS